MAPWVADDLVRRLHRRSVGAGRRRRADRRSQRSGDLYREFASKQDIDETAAVLEEIIAFDHLLSRIGMDVTRRPDRFLNYKSLILTLWARSNLTLSDGLDPIPLPDFRNFYHTLFEPNATGPSAQHLRVKTAMKTDFLRWFAGKSGMDHVALSRRLGKTLEHLFLEIEAEYGSVSPENLDPRFIHHFLVSG